MPKVQYKGTSHFREITAADWKSVGVEDQGKVVWDRDGTGSPHYPGAAQVHEVNDAAWAYLSEKETPGQFTLVEEAPAESAPAVSTRRGNPPT